ncbi:MAG: hypothetical protein KKB70_02175 [Proteobacteria bacterium]|nr:hypothetical protein [Pseudomonadota bacterium]MBU1612156.1 hypothetical protein [Pseudomonadota bacterium]
MRITPLILSALLIPFLTGCGTPLIQEQAVPAPGYSVRQAVAMQTLNPEAGGTEPVVGLDGKYAQQTMINYQEMPLPSKDAESVDLGSLFNVGGSK